MFEGAVSPLHERLLEIKEPRSVRPSHGVLPTRRPDRKPQTPRSPGSQKAQERTESHPTRRPRVKTALDPADGPDRCRVALHAGFRGLSERLDAFGAVPHDG